MSTVSGNPDLSITDADLDWLWAAAWHLANRAVYILLIGTVLGGVCMLTIGMTASAAQTPVFSPGVPTKFHFNPEVNLDSSRFEVRGSGS